MSFRNCSLCAILGVLSMLTSISQGARAQQTTAMSTGGLHRSLSIAGNLVQGELTIVQEPRMGNHFAFWAGAGFPMGDMANTSNERAGYAMPGFTMGLGYTVGISHELGWRTQIDFVSSPMDEDGIGTAVGGGASSARVSAGSWLTFWPMTGLEITGDVSHNIRFFGDALFGLFLGAMPQISFTDNSGSVTQNSATGAAFAYGFGAGVVVSKKVMFGLYYSTASPVYDVGSPAVLTAPGTNEIEQPTSILRVFLGVEF
jgi:hypothetical protein